MEQKNIREPVLEPQVKQTALLASPVYIGQAQKEGDKTYKERKTRRIEASPLGWAHPHPLMVYFPLLAK